MFAVERESEAPVSRLDELRVERRSLAVRTRAARIHWTLRVVSAVIILAAMRIGFSYATLEDSPLLGFAILVAAAVLAASYVVEWLATRGRRARLRVVDAEMDRLFVALHASPLRERDVVGFLEEEAPPSSAPYAPALGHAEGVAE